MSFFLNLEKIFKISLRMQYHTQPLLTHANLRCIRRLSDGLRMDMMWEAKGISTHFLIRGNVCAIGLIIHTGGILPTLCREYIHNGDIRVL